MRWGATDDEVAGPYPGAEIVPGSTRSSTMAVTIDARPEEVWPWLVQLGWDRAGWYSWDLLDNSGRPSAREVHPEWQDLAVGDQLRFSAMGRVGDAFRVRVLEPNRFLGLYGYADLQGRWLDPGEPRPSAYMEALWGFQLKALPHGRTRLVIGGYQTFRPRWIERFVIPWSFVLLVWPMQARMLAVLKRNVEHAVQAGGGESPEDRDAVTVRAEVGIERPPEVVFDYCSDLRHEPEWNPRMRSADKLTDGPVGSGTRFATTFASGPTMVMECTRYDRPRSWLLAGSSPALRASGGGDVSATSDGARLVMHVALSPRGPLKLAKPLMRRRLRPMLEQDLDTIKETLETREEPPQHRKET